MIGFSLDEDQQALRRSAAEFVRGEIVPRRREFDRHHEFPHHLYEAAHRLGWMTGWLPWEQGGAGLSLLDMTIIAEEIAFGDLGIATSMFANVLATSPIIEHGTLTQREEWLAPLAARPSFASFAWTEASGSSSLLSQPGATTVRREGNNYVLDGTKCFITNAPVCDFMLVFAFGLPSLHSMSCFIVPRDAAGVTITEPYRKLGQRASSTGDVQLTHVAVSLDRLLGPEGHGPKVALTGMSRSRAGVGAMAVGVARAAREKVVEWGHARLSSNGQPLIQQQDFRFRLAEIDMAIEAARLLTWRAAWEADHGVELARRASHAKLFGGELATRVTSMAVEMLGGLGYVEEGEVEKLMRDAKLLEIYEGPPAIQKTIIAEYATRRGKR